MKRILLINRILFLLSFLLPFFFFQMCGPSLKEKEAALEKAIQDSIEAQRQVDSITECVEQLRIQDSIKAANLRFKQESIKVSIDEIALDSLSSSNTKDNFGSDKSKKDSVSESGNLIEEIWRHMLIPTDKSISGLGITVLTVVIELAYFDYNSFKINDLLAFFIPLNLLLAIILILLFIFKKIKLSRIFSIISLLFFIVSVFLYHETGILWGFWVAFILNMIDLILVNQILFQTKQE